MNLTFHHLLCSYDGNMRYGKSPRTATGNATVLLLPGWGEWIEKYSRIINEWNTRGYDVVIAEWRGQGLSSRFMTDTKKSWLPSFDLLVDDLERLFRAELLNAHKIIIFGHSMGAHLGLRWFLERGRKYAAIKAFIGASPLHEFVTDPIPTCAAKLIITAAAWLGFDQAYAIGQKDFDQAAGIFEKNVLTHDENAYRSMVAELQQRPMLKVGGLTYGWLHAAMRSARQLEADLARGAPRISYLVIGPQADPLVVSKCFGMIASMLPNCRMHMMADAKHELLQETEDRRAQAWSWIDDFLKGLKA